MMGKTKEFHVTEFRRVNRQGSDKVSTAVRPWTRLVLAGVLVIAATGAHSQAVAAGSGGPFHTGASRLEFAATYSYWDPNGSINGNSYQSISEGANFGAAYYFGRYLGAQVQVGLHPQTVNDGNQTFSFGPVLRYRMHRFTPYIHVLAGATKLGGPDIPSLTGGTGYFYNPGTWGTELSEGGGVDYAIPGLHDRFAVRLMQADYEFNIVNFKTQTSTGGGVFPTVNAVNVGAGLVLRLGRR
jgi:hypothetical protein